MDKGPEESDENKITVRVEPTNDNETEQDVSQIDEVAADDSMQPSESEDSEEQGLDHNDSLESDTTSPDDSTDGTEFGAKYEPSDSTDGDTTTADDTSQQDLAVSAFPTSPKKSRKKLAIGSSLAVVGVACIGVWTLLHDKQPEIANTSSDTAQKVTLMGADIALIDGTAQVSNNGNDWQALAAGDTATQGMYYRTDDDSRLVVNLDDGSAIRLNSSSTVRLDSLDVTNVVVTNVEGEAYARLVKSDRTFSVKAGDETYTALGTAYSTLNTNETKGVEVYESTVKLTKADVDVSEGKYYYTDAKDAKDEDKLGTISAKQLQNDEFIKWNYTQDKKNKEFKDDLGYLVKIDEKTDDETKDDDKQKEETESAGGISLSGSKYDTGVKLTWSVKGVSASKGFKVLKSNYANPVFGKDGTDATYLSDSSARSFAWTLKDGKTYHFRVCTYTGDGCNNYSNDVAVTAPKVSGSDSSGPSGSVLLQQKYDNKVKWTLTGSAPDGYKLVWSKSPNPTYPGDDARYYNEGSSIGEINENSGTYYVRVCLYKSDYGCKIYSNQIVVNL